MGEVGHAVARQRLGLEEANALVLKLLDRYEHVFELPEGNPGVSFDKAYDMTSLTPAPKWLAIYEDVKAQTRQMGLGALG